METFLVGYGNEAGLYAKEAAVVPLLVQLRRFDVFMHFLSRYWDGIDTVDVVTDQIRAASAGMDWFKTNGDKLAFLCQRHLTNSG